MTGTYADGSEWADRDGGSLTITMLPACETVSGNYSDGAAYTNKVVNGAEINPGVAEAPGDVDQGFCSIPPSSGSWGFRSPYDAARNVDTGDPLVISSACSLVKSSTRLNPIPSVRNATYKMAVLTVVDEAPPVDAIRPPICFTDKTSLVTMDDIDFGLLNSFPVPASMPSLSNMVHQATQLRTTWYGNIGPCENVQQVDGTSIYGITGYGGWMSYNFGDCLLAVHLAIAEASKRAIVAGLVTYGMEIAAQASLGTLSEGLGGYQQCKKSAAIFARVMLGANAPAWLIEYTDWTQHDVFGEDRQMFTVAPIDVATARYTADGRPRDDYENYMLGSVEWSSQYGTGTIEVAGSNWDAYYRDIVANTLLPQMLALRLTDGAMTAWNRPEIFDYYDRVWFKMQDYAGAWPMNQFTKDMWSAHRGGPVDAPALVAARAIDDWVWLNYARSLDDVSIPAVGDFVVTEDASPATIIATAVWGNNVGIQLSAALTAATTVAISYTAGTDPIRDTFGNEAANLSGQAVTNETAV